MDEGGFTKCARDPRRTWRQAPNFRDNLAGKKRLIGHRVILVESVCRDLCQPR